MSNCYDADTLQPKFNWGECEAKREEKCWHEPKKDECWRELKKEESWREKEECWREPEKEECWREPEKEECWRESEKEECWKDNECWKDECRKEECWKDKCWEECWDKCKCKCEHEKKYYKSSAQFVSGINLMPPAVGQEIIGFWPLGNVQPVEIGVTAVADRHKIQLSGNNTILLQPGRYLIDSHALVANFDRFDPQGSDPIVTKLFLNGTPLDYTINSVDVINQLFVLNSTQLNKSNIIEVTRPNSTLQWMAGNTVSRDFHFDIYEASITVTEL